MAELGFELETPGCRIGQSLQQARTVFIKYWDAFIFYYICPKNVKKSILLLKLKKKSILLLVNGSC